MNIKIYTHTRTYTFVTYTDTYTYAHRRIIYTHTHFTISIVIYSVKNNGVWLVRNNNTTMLILKKDSIRVVNDITSDNNNT